MKLTFCSNVVIFIRCFILASAMLGIPALAIMWDWLPGSLNAAVASIIPNRADRNFETAVAEGIPLTNEKPITAELPVEFTSWARPQFVPANENEIYGSNANTIRSESSLAKGFEVRDPVSDSGRRISDANIQKTSLSTTTASGQLPENAAIPSQTRIQTSSPVDAMASGQPVQIGQGQQNQIQNDLLKEELTTLGVEQFTLQQWGNSGTLWRCSCQVRGGTIPGGLATCFEAVDTDSNRAITMVLTKIRDWKACSVARGI
ncbi:MAG: hypothetical protein PHQ75_00865 [Thermoguttaceae bacterium]|nr:hypothetical protein [Thermoguttaceae bacterium]